VHPDTVYHRVQTLLVNITLGVALAAAALLTLPGARILASAEAAHFNYLGGDPCNATLQTCINGRVAGDIETMEVESFNLYFPLAINTAPVFITYRDFEIVPASSHIKVGTTITFLIQDSRHEPYSFTPPYNFDSGPNLDSGSSFTFNFDQAGTITLLCGYHANMSATLVIEP
jgi:plastocyanin